MNNSSKYYFLTKMFIALMSLLIINVSIDAFEFQPINTEIAIEDFNYMNSFAEYVTEILLEHKDAFPEYQKESPSSKSQFAKHFAAKIIRKERFVCQFVFQPNQTSYLIPLSEHYLSSYMQEINPPPPKC